MSVENISIYNRLGKLATREILPETPKIKDNSKGEDKSFIDFLGDALSDIGKTKKDAESKISSVALGENGIAVHDAMIAMQKADVAFDIMNKVRAKIIRAYEEIMRTPI
jgi:flagellar hook-basal body complex protein FliE